MKGTIQASDVKRVEREIIEVTEKEKEGRKEHEENNNEPRPTASALPGS